MKMSFYDWCIKNDRRDLLEQWDYNKNIVSPYDVSYGTYKSYYFKCPTDKHDSELICIRNLIRTIYKRDKCTKCNSFAQSLINQYGQDAVAKYWDYELNEVDPWKISYKNNALVYIKCQKTDYHGSYQVSPNHFNKDGARCPYCFHRKIHPKDSLAQYCIDSYGKDFLDKYWDYNKNIKSPWEISPKTNKKVYFKCLNNPNHESFLIALPNFFKGYYVCKECIADNKKRIIDILTRIVNGDYVSKDEYDSIITFEDLTGQKFRRLTVVGFDYQKHLSYLLAGKQPDYYWLCQCDCGGENSLKSVAASHLKSGKIVSCGCWQRENHTGPNAYNWKGGVNSEDHKARHTPEGEKWRADVLIRDNGICQCCGSNKSLNVHHIYNFVNNLNLRYNIDNGIVLCEKCHGMTIKGSFHNVYGTKNNTPEQLREYILNKSSIDIYITHPKILSLTQQND